MEFTIRPVCLADAKDINEIRRMPGVMENILGIPSETLKSTEEFLSSQNPNSHQFAAVIKTPDGGERVVGTAGLHIQSGARVRHAADIGIMVHSDYQGKGVGMALMEALIDIADNWLMLVRLELTVYSDNDRAIALYEKLGFEKEGLLRKIAIRGGAYVDGYVMGRVR